MSYLLDLATGWCTVISCLSLLGAAWANPVVAVVVVDDQARKAGYALQIDRFVIDDALPVDVADGETLQLLGPRGEVEPLDVAPGEVWEVTGANGEAWMAVLGEDVRTDRIVVRGSDAAIAGLAAELDAELVTEGDTVWLEGPDILLAAARVSGRLRAEIDGVGLVRAEPRETAAPRALPQKPVGEVAAVPAVEGVSAPAPVAATPAAGDDGRLRDRARKARALEAEDRAEEATRRYAGSYLCRTQVLTLHPSGVFTLNGEQGRWSVGAPGLVRLETWEGELAYRAAIATDSRFCRDVWSPDTVL